MRSLPTGWNTLLAKLGVTRKRKNRAVVRKPLCRALKMELLEDRRVLTITVDTFLDERDQDLDDGDISLRDAILEALAGETIDFAPSLNGATIALLPNLGEIAFGKNLTIDASMLSSLTINADDSNPSTPGHRIFDITNPTFDVLVTLKNLTLTGGDVSGSGGAIQSAGSLNLQDCNFIDNEAGVGGGVAKLGSGNLTISNSTFVLNKSAAGGGVFAELNGSTMQVTGSTFTQNSADSGGGINVELFSNSTVQLERSTFDDNTATAGAGGALFSLLFGGSAIISHSVFTVNDARDGGGAISSQHVGTLV